MTTPIILTRTKPSASDVAPQETLEQRLRKRAEIRLQIQSRKSVLLNEPDPIAELLVEAADKIKEQEEEIKSDDKCMGEMDDIIARLEQRLMEADADSYLESYRR